MIKIGALAAVTFVALAAPAHAAWHNIGSVDFDRGGDHERQYGNFGGPVERLSFSVRGNEVHCRSVTATFGNGKTRQIFDGRIREGATVNVDLPGRERNVRRLDFRCRSDGRRPARINIGADLGGYEDAWRRNPAWSWIFGNGPGPRPPHAGNYPRPGVFDGWVRLGVESYEGRRDRETVSTGWKGRKVDQIALRAVDGDAQCRRVFVTFGNGKTRDLDIGNRGMLRQGDFRRIDLPGRDRNVTEVQLVCRPVGDRRVFIETYARK
ncbi:MAG: hypothetical protein AB7O49_09190 [Sphingomonadales bacterium]